MDNCGVQWVRRRPKTARSNGRKTEQPGVQSDRVLGQAFQKPVARSCKPNGERPQVRSQYQCRLIEQSAWMEGGAKTGGVQVAAVFQHGQVPSTTGQLGRSCLDLSSDKCPFESSGDGGEGRPSLVLALWTCVLSFCSSEFGARSYF